MPPVSLRHLIHPVFPTPDIASFPEDDGTLRTADGVLEPAAGDQPETSTTTVITVIKEEVEKVTRVTVETTTTTSSTTIFRQSPAAFTGSLQSSSSPVSSASASSSTLWGHLFAPEISTSVLSTSTLPSSTPSSKPSSSTPSETSSFPTSSLHTSTSSFPTSSIHTSTSSSSTPSQSPSSSPDLFPPFPTVLTTPVAAQAVMKPLAPGVVVGITLSSVLFALLLAICFIRRRSKTNREKARTWVTPFVEIKSVPVVKRARVDRKQEKRMEYLSERWQRIRGSRILSRVSSGGPGNASRSGVGEIPNGRQKGRKHRNHPGVPVTEEPRGPVPPPPIYREPHAGSSGDLFVSSMFPHGAVAKCNFEPRRPDELAILAGDHLRVVALYDDGWAMCKNGVGRRGVVPTSCLRVDRVRRR